MKKNFSVLSFLVVVTLSFSSVVSAADSCVAPGRNTELCYEMKHIRSLLNLLDAQRDTMQVNYPYVNTVAKDLEQILTSMLVRSDRNPHLTPLGGVRTQALLLASQASNQKIEALQTAQSIRSQCLSCHASQNPPSGHTWDDISEGSWDLKSRDCLKPGRNPYVCRSMLAMFAPIQYFEASENSHYQSFEMTESVSLEIVRIAQDLNDKKAFHTLELPFEQVLLESKVIAQMAKNRDPKVFQESAGLRNSCMQCHGER